MSIGSGPGPVDEAVLDDPDRLASADPSGMLRENATAGPQVRRTAAAAEEGGAASLAGQGPRSVVLVGSGVCRLAARALAALTGPEITAPVVVHAGPDLPRWVGAADLVVGLSTSGTNAAALSVLQAAGSRGCEVAGVGPADTPLAAVVSRARGILVAAPDQGPARARLWSQLTGLVCLAGPVGLVDVPGDLLDAVAQRLDDDAVRCRPTSESFVNPAKQLALQLAGSLPVVWGSSRLADVAARRFADMLAASARYPAVTGGFDDLWLGGLGVLEGPFGFGGRTGGSAAPADDDLFRDRVDEPEPVRARLVVVRDAEPDVAATGHLAQVDDLIERRHLPVTEWAAEEEAHPLHRLAQLIGVLDFAASYLGMLYGMDPWGPVGDGPPGSAP